MDKHMRSPWSKSVLILSIQAMLIGAPLQSAQASTRVQLAQAQTQAQQASIRSLIDKGIYWYERFRFDLAVQSFNKVLLIDPENASALRWQGLVDLAKGDVQATSVWLRRLENLYGANNPYARELAQASQLSGEKRQQLAELRFLANSERPPGDLLQRLEQLVPGPLVGDAAVQVFRIMANTPEGRQSAVEQTRSLIQRFPGDKRYRTLLADLGGTVAPAEPPRTLASAGNTNRATPVARPTPQPTQQDISTPSDTPPSAPEPSDFERGQALSERAEKQLALGDVETAASALQDAIDLNPDYPWFRYDLAILLDNQNDKGSKQAARNVMKEGLEIAPTAEMQFASALLSARQDRPNEAVALLERTPREQWTEGMTALEKRMRLGQHLTRVRTLDEQARYNEVASVISAKPRWRAEPEIQEIETRLRRTQQTRLRMSYEDAFIDGDPGISRIESREIPLQLDVPLDFEKTLFLRMDTLNTKAGRVDPGDAANFAKLGTVAPNDPNISPNRLDQNFNGHVVGLGIQTDQYRVDLGTTVGDYPVNDWVGGFQWNTSLGDGSLSIDIARRMVTGSVLSTSGATDPLTGQSWGGARRNGISAVYYEAFSPTFDFVGIARANLITGKNIPDNTEYNLQGIVGKTIFQRPGHEVEIGASLFLWSFKRNMRFYTFGQGGYYSPQAFGSLSFPITWTGNAGGWSWQLQARIGASESREDDAELYPLNPELAQAAAAQGNPTIQTGGPGGGTSTGLRLGLERQVMNNFILGGFFEIDRSEGFNPDRLQVYAKYSFGDFFELSVPPQGVSSYSRF